MSCGCGAGGCPECGPAVAPCLTVYAGAADPEVLRIYATPSDALPDLSGVTGGSVDVVRGCGTAVVATWALTLVSATPSLATLEYTFAADGLDVARPGEYRLRVTLTHPSGTRRLVPVRLLVLPY